MLTNKGQTLIEVIVVAMVGILVVSALTFAVIFSLRNASFAKNQSQATKLAQEGIERVRTGRDRNSSITGINDINNLPLIDSWSGGKPIWNYQITNNCGDNINTFCYFNVSSSGALQYIGAAAAMPLLAETVSLNLKRVIILSDTPATYQVQKQVTAVVQWTDFAGTHESKLTTILRKL